jgi:hypothetical protein
VHPAKAEHHHSLVGDAARALFWIGKSQGGDGHPELVSQTRQGYEQVLDV